MATVRAINSAGQMSFSRSFRDIFSCCLGSSPGPSRKDHKGHEVLDDENCSVDGVENGAVNHRDYGSVKSEGVQNTDGSLSGRLTKLSQSIKSGIVPTKDGDNDSALVLDQQMEGSRVSSQNEKGIS